MAYKTKMKKGQESLHREIIEDFEIYRKTKKKSIIKKYKEKELVELVNAHRLHHGQFPWFKAIEKRVKELQPK